MSFSQNIKEELERQMPAARHCRIAEIAAIIGMCGKVNLIENRSHHVRFCLKISTENESVAKKYFTLIRKTFNINTLITIRSQPYVKNHAVYVIEIQGTENVLKVVSATKLINQQKEVISTHFDSILYQQSCCKRSFLRGVFLSSGSITDPNKAYHFEIVTSYEEKAKQIQSIIKSFDLDAKIVIRKKYYVIYLKEGSQIVDMLNIMGAHKALMEFENVRIIKEMRNSVNRKVNCETANIHKTISASVKQVEDIQYIMSTVGIDSLSDHLVEIADKRLEYPDATLAELGNMLNPTVGKSGVNHRLRKISTIADSIRNEREI